MRKCVNQAVGLALAVTAAFVHADVVAPTVQGFAGTAPRAERSTPVQAGLGVGLVRGVFPVFASRQDTNPSAPAGEHTSTGGMLLGAVMIMAIVARRRWNTRG